MLEPDNIVRDPEYYLRQTSTPAPTFEGKGAKLLGIEGQWSQEAFLNLYRGYSPDGETKLAARIQKDRRGAVDWTFNRSKSVSVAKLIAGDSRIDAIETKALQKAMALLEKQVKVKVRKKEYLDASKAAHPKGWKYPERYSENLIWVAFRHPDSRAGDANSHDHVVIMTLSHDKQEGMWKSPELRYVDRKEICDVYHKELAKGLRKLGYNVEYDGKRVDLVDVPKDIQQEHSSRHNAIKAMEQDFERKKGRPLHSKTKGKLSLVDRPEKAEDKPLAQRRAEWIARLTKSQYSALLSVVQKAKSAVRDQWHKQTVKALDKLRHQVITQEQHRERERGMGIDR